MLVVVFCFFLLLFFFKQKTAYEMRISDWSSDVCSSDLSWVLRSKGCDQATRIVLIIPPTWWSKTWQWSIQSPRLSRSEERRVGKECVSTCRYRGSPYN